MEFTIQLTDLQRKNLIGFLNRVQLTGAEVPAYLEIVDSLNAPFLKKQQPVKEDKNIKDK